MSYAGYVLVKARSLRSLKALTKPFPAYAGLEHRLEGVSGGNGALDAEVWKAGMNDDLYFLRKNVLKFE